MAADPIRGAGGPQVRVAGARTHDLFEQYARMVYGLCRVLLRDPHEADDATQTTFVSAYKSLLGGREVREPAAWLATIARNECAARARARMREPLPLFETDVAQAPGPELELERKTVVRELQQAISELPESQREVVVLRDLYGLPYSEVGAALGISVASVESLLFRARRRLRVSLKPLTSGALVVPVAVREGIAQALPAFSTAGAAGGGAGSGAVGFGLLAKLAGGPVAVKAAAGLAAAVAAGSIAAVEVERDGGHVRSSAGVSLQTRHKTRVAAGVRPAGRAPASTFVARAVNASADTPRAGDPTSTPRRAAQNGPPVPVARRRGGRSSELGGSAAGEQDDHGGLVANGLSHGSGGGSSPGSGRPASSPTGSNDGEGSGPNGVPSGSSGAPPQVEPERQTGSSRSQAGVGSRVGADGSGSNTGADGSKLANSGGSGHSTTGETEQSGSSGTEHPGSGGTQHPGSGGTELSGSGGTPLEATPPSAEAENEAPNGGASATTQAAPPPE